MRPTVDSFFDEATNTVSHIVADPATGKAAIIDSVLDFDSASGRTDTASADKLIAHIKAKGLTVEWVLETHIHADHLTAAPYLLERLGGSLGVGGAIAQVQRTFGEIFNVGPGFARDGSQFHRLFRDGETFRLGDIEVRAIHTPGHTPACMTYVIGDAAFVGDTLFMPDYGTARCDFPGGDARQLYRSIQKIFALPPETRLFLCHDYKAPGRDEYRWETSVAEERASNIHVHDGVTEEEFVAMRTARDATLSIPRLILPSVQVNMRAGHFPSAEENGVSYLKLPLNAL
ncbi:MBL fold metallo-hydrolase [Oceanibaculum indicum]|uniref:Metallo-beta-lactamase n=1 Tax=Oceanibaculum indicum P24 TaxID=1207063 RepID=K2JKD5_9PROT|nr:MBL fold metallo-hydrolase [Oceanibaculum indicum]EKE75778.1 metallo-beta-lactamase [Oceanibaculum indicum P24]